ncbi:MAG TPA: hypothetical protein DG753_09810 [Clostridium sp.]|nr:hypothetical protein [Clostridium sp.]
MKRNLILKLITGTVITTTLFSGTSFKANGQWRVDSQGNYYFNDGSGFSFGWKKIDNVIYYFDNNGVMQKGWIKYNDAWYFLDEAGALKTGWINFNNNWYYSNSVGVMQTGIIKIGGKTYCFADNGVMQTKNMIIDGQFYTIATDGSVVGTRIPEPDKVFDEFGNCIQSNSSISENNISPIESMNMQKLVDTSEAGDFDAPTRKFTVTFRDYNGDEIDKKTVKEGNSVDIIDANKRDGFKFIEWNTKIDGSGNGYNEDDQIRIHSDLNLYAVYKQEAEVTPVSSISIEGENEVEIGKRIQLIANIKPSSATNTNVKWNIVNGTGEAVIDNSTGIIEGIKAGTVTIYAEAEDNSEIRSKDYVINVVEAKNLVESITITGPKSIDVDNGTAQLVAEIKPDNVSNNNIKWIINSGSKYASIDEETGLVTAIANGEVEVVAKAVDGSGKISEPYTISITNQQPKLERINIATNNNIYKISKGKTVEFNAFLTPNTDLSNEQSEIEWSAKYISGVNKGENVKFDRESNTKIILTGTNEKGEIEVRAVSKNNPNIYSSRTVRVVQDAESVEIIATDDTGKQVSEGSIQNGTTLVRTAEITKEGQVLNLSAKLGPNDTETKGVEWSIVNDNSSDDSVIATLSSTNDLHPTLTPKKDGNVTIRATAKDNSKVYGELKVKISGQPVKATSINIDKIIINRNGSDIEVKPEDYVEVYTGDTIEFEASVDAAATNKKITWLIAEGRDFVKEKSKENNKYVLEVVNPGKFRVIASADNGTGISTTKDINAIRTATSIMLSSKTGLVSYIQGIDYMVAEGKDIDFEAIANPSDDTLGSDINWSIENVIEGDTEVRLDKAGGNNQNETSGNVSKQSFLAVKTGDVKVIAKHKTGIETHRIVRILPITTDIDLKADKYNIELDKDETGFIQMTATSNINAYSKYKWECKSSNKNLVAEISDSGRLTIERIGDISGPVDISVTVRALDGSGKEAHNIIKVSPKAPIQNNTQGTTQNN